MSHAHSWLDTCPDRIKKRISCCTNCNLRLESQSDPTKFIVWDQHDAKLRCTVGNPHRCSCSSSQPCVHILFVLITHFKVSPMSVSIWQKSVSELELSEWIAAKNESKGCIFCREAVVEGRQCQGCKIQFHERCLQLGAATGKYKQDVCPKCASKILPPKARPRLECEKCHCACRDDCFKCLLCDNFYLCAHCYKASNTHASHPFSHRDAFSPAPTSTFAQPYNVEELLYREINPEDYEVLTSLDNGKRKILPPHVLLRLPIKKYDVSGSVNDCCPVCQQIFSARDLCHVLPCGHTMHRVCGQQWLSQYSNECPIDHLAVDGESQSCQLFLLSTGQTRNKEAQNRVSWTRKASSLPPLKLRK